VCGFADPSHMTRRYGAHFGVTPTEARMSQTSR
jgi:transcriptional regulator GlxA family with amidase domain